MQNFRFLKASEKSLKGLIKKFSYFFEIFLNLYSLPLFLFLHLYTFKFFYFIKFEADLLKINRLDYF